MPASCAFCGEVNERGGRYCSVRCQHCDEDRVTKLRAAAHGKLLDEGWAVSTRKEGREICAGAYHPELEADVEVRGNTLKIAMGELWTATRMHAGRLKGSNSSS